MAYKSKIKNHPSTSLGTGKSKIRIGILGGTFDPIHKGHIYLAKTLLQRLHLDKIIFIPAYLPPHKAGFTVISARHRLNMVKLAIGNNKKLKVSDIEIRRKGKSYSVQTLRQIRDKYGKDAEIFFITGSDSLRDINMWKDLEGILSLCKFAVVKRPGFPVKNARSEFILIDIGAKDISSTGIRKRMIDGKTVEKFLPLKVSHYIKKNRLYN